MSAVVGSSEGGSADARGAAEGLERREVGVGGIGAASSGAEVLRAPRLSPSREGASGEGAGSDQGEVQGVRVVLKNARPVGWPYRLAPRGEVTALVLAELRQAFHIPREFELAVPEAGSTFLTAPPPGWVGFNAAFLEAGVRLPLHPFLVAFLKATGLSPCQLVPNAWATLLGFVVLSKVYCKVEPDLELFLGLATCKWRDGVVYVSLDKHRLVDKLPTSNKHWKERHFYVRGLDSEINPVALRECKPFGVCAWSFGEVFCRGFLTFVVIVFAVPVRPHRSLWREQQKQLDDLLASGPRSVYYLLTPANLARARVGPMDSFLADVRARATELPGAATMKRKATTRRSMPSSRKAARTSSGAEARDVHESAGLTATGPVPDSAGLDPAVTGARRPEAETSQPHPKAAEPEEGSGDRRGFSSEDGAQSRHSGPETGGPSAPVSGYVPRRPEVVVLPRGETPQMQYLGVTVAALERCSLRSLGERPARATSEALLELKEHLCQALGAAAHVMADLTRRGRVGLGQLEEVLREPVPAGETPLDPSVLRRENDDLKLEVQRVRRTLLEVQADNAEKMAMLDKVLLDLDSEQRLNAERETKAAAREAELKRGADELGKTVADLNKKVGELKASKKRAAKRLAESEKVGASAKDQVVALERERDTLKEFVLVETPKVVREARVACAATILRHVRQAYPEADLAAMLDFQNVPEVELPEGLLGVFDLAPAEVEEPASGEEEEDDVVNEPSAESAPQAAEAEAGRPPGAVPTEVVVDPLLRDGGADV